MKKNQASDYMKKLRQENDEIIAGIYQKEIQSKPNFYAILPAKIRYDSDLTYLERIIYAEISALSNVKGYCFATNSFFVKHYKNSERTVSRAINCLAKKGYISTFYEQVGDKTYRKIYINDINKEENVPVISDENGEGVDKNVYGGVDKNVYHNSTSTNNTSSTSTSTNNTSTSISIMSSIPPTELSAKASLPEWYGEVHLGKNSHERLGKIYELLYERSMGVKKVFPLVGKSGAALKSILKEYCEAEAVLILVVFFEWRGMGGNSSFEAKRLLDAGYPIAFVAADSSKYHAFIRNVMNLKTETEIFKVIEKTLDKITGRKK